MRFKHVLGPLLFLAAVPCFVLAQEKEPTPAPKTLTELRTQLSQHASDPRFEAGTFGIKIVSAKSGAVVFEHDAEKLLSPASNSKLYTVGLALDRLGQNYRLRTSLYAEAKPEAGVLKGNLTIFGRGDPGINARLAGGDILKALQPLVEGLTNAGVLSITGDLIADDSYFVGPEYGSGWTWDDLENYYGAPISALTINDNTVEISVKPGATPGSPCQISITPDTCALVISNRAQTVAAGERQTIRFYRPIEGHVVYISGQMPEGSHVSEELPVARPAEMFVDLFHRALEQNGVRVQGTTRVKGWLDLDCIRDRLPSLVEIAGIDSQPMSQIAREILKPSQNLYTDLMLAHVGEKSRGSQSSRQSTSEDLGLRELRSFLSRAGVRSADVHFEEGSGLSRNNLTTANATIALLQYMSRHPASEAYWSGLPVAGVDGTLRSRMKDTPAAGNVRAKTGTLRWAYSLSGDLKTAAGERLLFSIMLNRYYNTDAQRSTRSEIDMIPILLAGYAGTVEE